MAKTRFDRKFGDEFIGGLPASPGVYEVLDEAGHVVYVGKARNLRRRLQQYRNARRRKKHLKMREIVGAAHSIRVTPLSSELEALLHENRLIQSLKPRFNVSGAYSFLYPCVGLIRSGRELHLCYSTSPTEFPMFAFYGSYRSRLITKEAFFALLEVLALIGHREPRSKTSQHPRVRFALIAAFRQIADDWVPQLESFLRGESRQFLESAVMALVEKPYARRHATEYQEAFDALARFYEMESLPLRKALADLNIAARFVPQIERDRLFLLSREARKLRKISRRGVDRSS